jgi:CRP-like cAMP-binding protein
MKIMNDVVDINFKKELLKKQSCFSQLLPEETEILAGLLVEKQVPTGETIVTEGEPVNSVYIIVNGTADVRHVTIENNAPKIYSLATLGAGDAIGLNETGFYSLSGVRTATVVATTDMVLLSLSMAAFHGFSLSYSHVNDIMKQQAKGFLDVK